MAPFETYVPRMRPPGLLEAVRRLAQEELFVAVGLRAAWRSVFPTELISIATPEQPIDVFLDLAGRSEELAARLRSAAVRRFRCPFRLGPYLRIDDRPGTKEGRQFALNVELGWISLAAQLPDEDGCLFPVLWDWFQEACPVLRHFASNDRAICAIGRMAVAALVRRIPDAPGPSTVPGADEFLEQAHASWLPEAAAFCLLRSPSDAVDLVTHPGLFERPARRRVAELVRRRDADLHARLVRAWRLDDPVAPSRPGSRSVIIAPR